MTSSFSRIHIIDLCMVSFHLLMLCFEFFMKWLQSPFDSIPKTVWYIFTTFTAVGYGDMFPKTVYGKIFGMFTMFLSILALALPITVIGTNFHIAYDSIIGR